MIMISETQFARGFKRLLSDTEAESFRELRIQELDSIPGLFQCFNPATRRPGLAFKIPVDGPLPDDLPPDSNKAVVSIVEVEGEGALFLLTKAERCLEPTFLGIARGIANYF